MNSVSLRIGLVIIFALIGFAFPLSFALAALIAFSVYDEFSKPSTREQLGQSKLKLMTPESENWMDFFRAACESPAEVAFLNAMIDEFNLQPKDGFLRGNELNLRMQVPVSQYRLDFLVDSRLVVEVDGAAYHSSVDAVASDQRRDAYLCENGFEVLRIAAKTTLYFPQDAIAMVKEARAVVKGKDQKRSAELRNSFRPEQIAIALKDAAIGVSDGISSANAYVHREAEKQKEKDRIEVERRTNEKLAALQADLDADEELRKIYDELKKDW